MNKIKEGALFGLGFSVVMMAVVYAYSMIVAGLYDYEDYDFGYSADDVEVLESRIEKRDDRLVVLGQYRNRGETNVSNLTVKADFFSEDGTFLDQCEDYSAGTLGPGEAEYFRLQCSSCADLTLDDVASHKVQVTDRF